eukprot:TRINITY_DN1058_c0_g1_i1.p1 TRINITY_DN1058_c0_g1~~TRINITY_DN1058_c0_g1_i1.p1  ORF type:complete len:266 (-),score=47.68 TRINITY_DN1058_c0_g1_i1:16-813(-)
MVVRGLVKSKKKVLKITDINLQKYFPFYLNRQKPGVRDYLQKRYDERFRVISEIAPVDMEKTYRVTKWELVHRGMRTEKTRPEVTLKRLNFEKNLEYMKNASMVLVFHNFGLNAVQMNEVRFIAYMNRCQWVRDANVGELYMKHLRDKSLRPLLHDDSAVFFVCYKFNPAPILKAMEKYKGIFQLAACVVANPHAKHHRILFPNELAEAAKLPPLKEYVPNNLIAPLVGHASGFVSTLSSPVQQLLLTLSYRKFKMEEEQKGKKE